MQATLQAGQLFFGTYETVRLLGSGGMGQAYLGRNVRSQQPIVIKVMHPHLAAEPGLRRLFAAEIELLRRVRHPNVVALIDAEPDHPEQPFMIQEYVAGESLQEIIRREGRMTLRRVALLLGQLCRVLHLLHGKGILHRDLSAANIMIVGLGAGREQVKLMDFGLASLGASAGVYLSLEKLAAADGTIGGGTPDYIAPEQIRKETVDRRSDLYSLGVLLYQMLTGRPPFAEAKSVEEILDAHLLKEPPRFETIGVYNLPASVEIIVQCLLAKNPAGRPAEARDLAALFSRAVGFEIAPAEAFAAQVEAAPPVASAKENLDVLDRLKAWMPEQIAVMKLRGFLDQVGGEVLESLPGKIRVRLLDPRTKSQQQRAPGLLGFLGAQRTVLTDPKYLHLELHMEKKTENGRSLVELSIILEPGARGSREEAAMRRGFGERICRELRAYLMV